MHLPLSPLKRSLLTKIGVVATLSVTLAACGGGSGGSSSADIHPNCTPGSNTQLVKVSKVHKIGWSQNALDGAWRYAEEASIEGAAKAAGYQLL